MKKLFFKVHGDSWFAYKKDCRLSYCHYYDCVRVTLQASFYLI